MPLQEEQKWLAEERIREEIEKRDDVVKRGHMGDFYRCTLLVHLGNGRRLATCGSYPSFQDGRGTRGRGGEGCGGLPVCVSSAQPLR